MNKYLIIPDYSNIEDYIRVAKENDLGFEYNDFYTPMMLDDEKTCEERIVFYATKDIPDFVTSHGDFYDVTVFSADKEIVVTSIKRIYQSMDVAKKVGAKKVIFHTNFNSLIPGDFYFNNWVEKNEEVFIEVCSKYPDIQVLMENMFDMDFEPLKALAERMKDVDNFGVCLDYAHAFLSPTPEKEWAENLSSYIKHVHINDNDGKKDLHLAVGDGIIDWNEFSELKDKFFPDASILIEVNGLEKINKSLDFLKAKGCL